jgi:hypothetical protein
MTDYTSLAGKVLFGAGTITFTAVALVPLLRDGPPDRTARTSAPTPIVVALPTPQPEVVVEYVAVPSSEYTAPDYVVLAGSEAEADVIRVNAQFERDLVGLLGESPRTVRVVVVESDEQAAAVIRTAAEQNATVVDMGGRPFKVLDLRGELEAKPQLEPAARQP